MNAQEFIQLYNEGGDKDTFIKEAHAQTGVEEDEAATYWDLIDAAIESEQP